MPRLRLLFPLLVAGFAASGPVASAQTLTVPENPPPLTEQPGPRPTPTTPDGGDGGSGSGSSGSGSSSGGGSSSSPGGGTRTPSASELPQTGSDETAALLLLGVALVLAGSGVRLRAGDPHALR